MSDPFADDVLERLVRSNQGYQRAHGHYIVPLAERLLAVRRENVDLRNALAMLRSAWNAHMETCPQPPVLPFHPGPSQADLEAWRDAPSGTA